MQYGFIGQALFTAISQTNARQVLIFIQRGAVRNSEQRGKVLFIRITDVEQISTS